MFVAQSSLRPMQTNVVSRIMATLVFKDQVKQPPMHDGYYPSQSDVSSA